MDRAVGWAYTRPRLRRGALSASIRGPEWRYHAHGAAMRRAAAQQLLLRRHGNSASDTAALPRDLRRWPGHGHSPLISRPRLPVGYVRMNDRSATTSTAS